MSVYILVVDDEPDVEHLFRQHFRRDLRSGRFLMEFVLSAPEALARAANVAEPTACQPDHWVPSQNRYSYLPNGSGCQLGGGSAVMGASCPSSDS